jgi:hypothetical protein
MKNVILLRHRSAALEAIITIVVPLTFGIITGILLGISEPIYLVLSIVGIAGGFFAGLEHEYALEGFYRGVLGGTLFGVGILLANGIADKAPKADLPDPEILLVVITGLFGAALGAWGGRTREKWEKRQAAAVSPSRTPAEPQSSSTASASR